MGRLYLNQRDNRLTQLDALREARLRKFNNPASIRGTISDPSAAHPLDRRFSFRPAATDLGFSDHQQTFNVSPHAYYV